MVKLGDYTKEEVEDFTGRIPLFLEKCVVGGKIDLNINFFAQLYSQAMSFEQEIQTKCNRDISKLHQYVTRSTHTTLLMSSGTTNI